MEIRGSIKSIHQLEQIFTRSFKHITVKGNADSKTFTRIQEIYPDGANPFQPTVWLRFTYCLHDGTAQMKVSQRDVGRFMKILAERKIRISRIINGRTQDSKGLATQGKQLGGDGATDRAVQDVPAQAGISVK